VRLIPVESRRTQLFANKITIAEDKTQSPAHTSHSGEHKDVCRERKKSFLWML